MFTPFDTAHMTHRANRHIPATQASREANRELRARRQRTVARITARILAAFWRLGTAERPAEPRF